MDFWHYRPDSIRSAEINLIRQITKKKPTCSFEQVGHNQLKPEEEEGVSTSSLICQAMM